MNQYCKHKTEKLSKTYYLKRFNISYPQSLQDEYEKAQLFNSNSGDPLWEYLNTYYPDEPRTNDEETKALMIKLLESEFIEPNYEDYI